MKSLTSNAGRIIFGLLFLAYVSGLGRIAWRSLIHVQPI